MSADVERSVAALEEAGLEVLQLGPPQPATIVRSDMEVSFGSITGVGIIGNHCRDARRRREASKTEHVRKIQF